MIRMIAATLCAYPGLLLGGCQDPETSSGERLAPPSAPPMGEATGGRSYDYQLALAGQYLRDPNITGIDSKVEVWRSLEVEISTDYGIYGGDPVCGAQEANCRMEREVFAGRDAVIARYWRPHSMADEAGWGAIFVHIPVTSSGIDLNIFLRCETEHACDEAFDAVREGLTFTAT